MKYVKKQQQKFERDRQAYHEHMALVHMKQEEAKWQPVDREDERNMKKQSKKELEKLQKQ